MKYNGENLREVLEAHKRWLYSKAGSTYEDRADFTGADLYGADLCGANLYGANLREADLRGVNLRSANLRVTDLTGADLTGANLMAADLTEADLTGANLYGANLYGAKLTVADLENADLIGANLSRANLMGADLYGADLSCTDLRNADLTGINLNEARNLPFIHMACPDAGAFVGWKKCTRRVPNKYVEGAYVYEDCIVKLLIPEYAERSSATTRKCRASHAIVLEIQTLEGEVLADVYDGTDVFACSMYDSNFIYRPGETVQPREPFDTNRWNECGSGIHFFINRQEAVNY